jgi:hypothetical protein
VEKGFFSQISILSASKSPTLELQSHMVTLGEDADGPRGLDWLYLCYRGLDLAVVNLADACAALE